MELSHLVCARIDGVAGLEGETPKARGDTVCIADRAEKREEKGRIIYFYLEDTDAREDVAASVVWDSSAETVSCDSDSKGSLCALVGVGVVSRPKVGAVVGLMRKYVDIGAGPEYSMWKGMR